MQASAADLGISMGDAARIDVDSPLWDQTTFIGLIKMALLPNSDQWSGRFRHFAWMSNPLSGLNSTATLLQAKQLVGLSKLSKNQPTFNHLYPPTGKNFHLSRLTIIGRVASLKARPGSRWWVRWLFIGDRCLFKALYVLVSFTNPLAAKKVGISV